MNLTLIKTHIDVSGYQVDYRLIKKTNPKLLPLNINIISCVWNVILSFHRFTIMLKTRIIKFSVILDVLAAKYFLHTKL